MIKVTFRDGTTYNSDATEIDNNARGDLILRGEVPGWSRAVVSTFAAGSWISAIYTTAPKAL